MNLIDQLIGNEAGNVIQFIKYGISGCIAVAAHILVFHLVAWKMFFAFRAPASYSASVHPQPKLIIESVDLTLLSGKQSRLPQ